MMRHKTWLKLLVVVLLASWQNILYAADETSHSPFYQYLVGEFIKDKTDKFIGKYQPDNAKETVEVAYLPLRPVLTAQADKATSESMAVFNSALDAYLATLSNGASFIKLSATQDRPRVDENAELIAQILVICDDLIAPKEKIQRIGNLIEQEVEVIITGHYLDKPEENAIKVRLIIVSLQQQRLEKKQIDFQADQLICVQNDQKQLCSDIYKQMLTTLNAVIFDENRSDAGPNAPEVSPNESIINKNDNATSQPTHPVGEQKVGLLPFSRLASPKVQNQIGGYYDAQKQELEKGLINTLKKKPC